MSETVMGPYKIDDANTILHAKVEQRMPLNTWSNVTISLLNAKKQYLTGFGDGFWHEDGRDAEGYYWNQQVNSYEAKLVVNKPGEYYLKVSPESDFSRREKKQRHDQSHFLHPWFQLRPAFCRWRSGADRCHCAAFLQFFPRRARNGVTIISGVTR